MKLWISRILIGLVLLDNLQAAILFLNKPETSHQPLILRPSCHHCHEQYRDLFPDVVRAIFFRYGASDALQDFLDRSLHNAVHRIGRRVDLVPEATHWIG